MNTIDPNNLERDLAEAHLLITRHEYTEARSLIAQLSRAGVPSKDTRPLLDEIERRIVDGKAASERKRDIRYYLRLQSSTARIGWFVAAIAGSTYAVWNGSAALTMAHQRGFGAVITTMVATRAGSHPWTRPIYIDLIQMSALLAASVAALVVIIWASRDVAQWEEIDAPLPSRYGDL